MNDVTPSSAPAISAPAILAGAEFLAWPVVWLEVDTLRLAMYDTGAPAIGAQDGHQPHDVPLLLLHGVNAAASAFEWEPFAMRQAPRRRVLALDLPGFGLSDKPNRAYTPDLMHAAIGAAIDRIDAPEVDIGALSLSCEFAAEVVLARPRRVRSLALVSPTGMETRRIGEKYDGGATRQTRGLRELLRRGQLGRLVYRGLSQRAVVHHVLGRSWGAQAYDPRLLQHAMLCARQAGAHHAPLDFVTGALSTTGIIERYRSLPVPVWVAHGRRGAFTDFGSCPVRTGTVAAGNTFRLQREVFDAGSMPHFEMADAFDAAYRRFLRALAPSAFRWRHARPGAGATTFRPAGPRATAHKL